MNQIPEADDRERKAAVIMVVLSAFSTPMMLSAANVALPSIARDLHIDAVLLSWVPMAFLMAGALFVLVFGRLADMFGRKRVFLIGTLLVIISSLFAALATNGAWLIAGRFLQGVSAAMLYATQVAIVSSICPPAKRGAIIGYTVSWVYLGLMTGPILGGWLIELFNWRVSFLLHVPLSIVVLLIGLLRVPHEWRADERGAFDVTGFALYGVAIVLFMIGISRLPGADGGVLIACGCAGIWVFLRHEHRHSHPIFDVELFYTNRVFTMSCLASLVMYTATYANVVLVSLYLQYLKDISPATTGLVMMSQPLVMAIFSPLAGRLSDRVEPRAIASIGMATTAFGLMMLGTLDGSSSIALIVVYLITTGFGFSLFSSPNANAMMSSVEGSDYGRASGAVAVMRVIGQVASMGLVAMVFALILGPVHITPGVYAELGSAIRICFVTAAVVCIPGILFSLSRGRVRAVA